MFLGILASFGLALLFGIGKTWLQRRVSLGLAMTLVILELLATQAPLMDLRPLPSQLDWVGWLRNSPEDTTIVHVPMAQGGLPEDYARTTYWMCCQMYHGRRMANGYAGFVPGHTMALAEIMTRFPDEFSISILQRLGITHVLASPEWTSTHQAEKLEPWKSQVALQAATPQMTIYRIIGAKPQSQ